MTCYEHQLPDGVLLQLFYSQKQSLPQREECLTEQTYSRRTNQLPILLHVWSYRLLQGELLYDGKSHDQPFSGHGKKLFCSDGNSLGHKL